MVILVLAMWIKNRGGTGCRAGGLKKETAGLLVWRPAGGFWFYPPAGALFPSCWLQSGVPLSQRQVPPAAPQPGRARTGAVSVACARSEQSWIMEWPNIAGVNE